MARNKTLKALLDLKNESDRGNFTLKAEIFRKLYKKAPDEFLIDSADNFAYGVTHVPTRFRFHIPRTDHPEGPNLEIGGLGHAVGKGLHRGSDDGVRGVQLRDVQPDGKAA